MKKHHEFVKDTLLNCIAQMDSCRELYAKNPKKDFTRNRKLSFQTLITLLLYTGGNSNAKELFEYFGYDVDTVSSSAFVQQREKLLPCALECLFHEFTDSFTHKKTFKGYRLLAIDGSSVSIPRDSDSIDSYYEWDNIKGFNLLHLNAIYDLCNQVYTDALVQPRRKMNEFDAFAKMVDRSKISQKSIIIADRGYESYNLFAHVEQKGCNYLIRVKDIGSNGILSSFDLPYTDEFDIKTDVIITKKQTKEVRANPNRYKVLSTKSRFDYLDLHNKIYYPISLRVLRIKISDCLYETFITNLNSEKFLPCDIKKLYALRWGIETSFRKLKYTVGLANFHSKKINCIIQEIFSRLTMYNFYEMITAHIIVATKSKKYSYKVNFSLAVLICKRLLLPALNARAPDVKALLGKHAIPIRIGRSSPRNLHPKSCVSFLYRVA